VVGTFLAIGPRIFVRPVALFGSITGLKALAVLGGLIFRRSIARI